ncbi:MAG: hypothetical protein M3Y27_01395 [Acidobacteriota bacterium]|nr:hypothetical protein [Acidobacteriota bacterium]
MSQALVSGSFRSLFLYDLCEEIRLDELRKLLGSPLAGREPGFRHLAPEYVRFERPPVVETLEPVLLEKGARLRCTISYYDYGVVSVEFELPFEFDWARLVKSAGTWMTAPEVEKKAADVVRLCRERVSSALVKAYDYQLTEDYYVVQIRPLPNEAGTLSATQLIADHGPAIAQIVRGETTPLSDEETAEVLHSRLSYYPNDLLVVSWTAALVYDTAESSAPTIQLLEYANSQLLEFRHYDHVLTRLLAHVYDAVNSGSGFLGRWRLAREAERLNAIQLDVGSSLSVSTIRSSF